jgi:hypothetical protein
LSSSKADPRFTRCVDQLLNTLQTLWTHWSRLESDKPDSLCWSPLGIPDAWVASEYRQVLRHEHIRTWSPTVPWLNRAIYEQAVQRLLESREPLSETATKIEALWADLADQIASLPQIYLGL